MIIKKLSMAVSMKAVVQIAVAVCVVMLTSQRRSEASGTFIPAPGRVDMVYDSPRSLLYITSGDSILRYDTRSNSFLTPFVLGGNLSGIDLSPDGQTLVVADTQHSENQVWIDEIDLQTGASQKVTFPRAFDEGGTYTVAFGNDGTVLITSTFEGSGWVPMRRYDPVTGVSSEIASVRQDSMLTASADRSVIGFEESNISDGSFGRLRVADQNLLRKSGYTDGTSWFNYEIGVNRNGTQFALPTYGGTFIYDANLQKLTTLGQYAAGQPIGVAYSPVNDLVYFAWADTQDIRVYDTTSFTQVADYDFENTFQHPGNHAFTQGRLKLSQDGSLLFSTVQGGVRYLQLPTTVPEPSLNLSILALGALGAGSLLKRKQKSTNSVAFDGKLK